MTKGTLIGAISALALALAAVVTHPANAQQYYGPGMGYGYGMGPGMMGPGMGYGYGMGPGTMGPGMGYGYGMGPGMMGWGYGPQPVDLNLSANDVKSYLERWVASMGNPNLKAGPVTEKDSSTISADIVTTDKDALVQRFSVDRHTGFWRPAQ